jgi:hypothetical protein
VNVLRWLAMGVALVVGLVLLIPALLVVTALYGMAWATRRLAGASPRDRASVPWRDLVEYEPVVGWRPRPSLDVFGRADDVFHLTTGNDGWRGQVSFAEADVIVFGDSFAFGHGADDGRMFTAYTRGVKVKPIGSDGYDMVHSLLWLERSAAQMTGKTVVLFPFYGNDLLENLLPAMRHYRKPFVRQAPDDGAWEVVTEHVNPEPWPFPTSTDYHGPLAEICCEGSDLQRRVMGSCEYLIGRAREICADAGAELIVMGVPDRIQLSDRGRRKLQHLAPSGRTVDPLLPDRMIGEICDGLGVRFIALSDHLGADDYLVQDIHWRTSGHRKVGHLFAELALSGAPRRSTTSGAR